MKYQWDIILRKEIRINSFINPTKLLIYKKNKN